MKLDYLEIKERLTNLSKKGELDNSKLRNRTASERLKVYANIFLGNEIDVSKIDSTNLSDFIRKALKDFHPDADNLDPEFRDIAAYMTYAYTDLKKKIDIHPTFAMNIEYVSKQELENDQKKEDTKKEYVTKESEPSKQQEDLKKAKEDTKTVPTEETGMRVVVQPVQSRNDGQSKTSKTDVVDVLWPKDFSNTKKETPNNREIVIHYDEVKERLLKASKEHNLTLAIPSSKERYIEYCKVILGVEDYANIDSANFRDVCAQIANDFSNEKIASYGEKIFATEQENLQNIQNYLNGVLGELNGWFEVLSDYPYKISYVGRSLENQKQEAQEYNKSNVMGADKDHSKEEPQFPSVVEEKENTIPPEKPSEDHLEEQRQPEDSALIEEQHQSEEPEKKDVKAYIKAIGKLLPYALAGAGVGLTAATVMPTIAFSGLGTIRIAYSTAKLVNKVVSKGFLHGKPTPVDNIVMNAKEKLKEKYGDTKAYKAVEKINEALKNPKVQWFLNGAAVGYKIGEALDLHDKLNNFLHPEKTYEAETIRVSSPNNALDQDTSELDATNVVNNNPATPNNAIPTEPLEPSSPSYADLNTGENIDLSGIEHGFVNSANAMSEADPVHLLTEFAQRENGTSIKLLKLPDGSNFTGNIGELLDSGIDPNQVAARIVNQNGEYAWLNLQDILDVYNNGMGMSR